MRQDETEIIDSLLSRIDQTNHGKVMCLLDDCLHNGIICLDIDDLKYCFTDQLEIEYLEFKTRQNCETFFSTRGKIKNLLFVISSGENEELTILEVQNYLHSIVCATGHKLEPDKMFWSQVEKSPAGLLRILVQF